MSEDDRSGWWEVAPREVWVCPNCKEASAVELWQETEAECEDCGSHDARKCPKCGDVFDHVWGAKLIEEASIGKD